MNASILYYEEKAECDICDKINKCVILDSISGRETIIICEQCIDEIKLNMGSLKQDKDKRDPKYKSLNGT